MKSESLIFGPMGAKERLFKKKVRQKWQNGSMNHFRKQSGLSCDNWSKEQTFLEQRLRDNRY